MLCWQYRKMIVCNNLPSCEAVRFGYSDVPHAQKAQKDLMYCPHVVINLNLLCGTLAVLAKTLQLPSQPPTPPTGCKFFADHRVEMGRLKPSTCSLTGYNYRPLPARLPSQPHPRMHRGSLPLPSPSGWLLASSWPRSMSCGATEGDAMCTL